LNFEVRIFRNICYRLFSVPQKQFNHQKRFSHEKKVIKKKEKKCFPKAKLLLEATFFIIIFTIPEVSRYTGPK
jgi:hypothetical protein